MSCAGVNTQNKFKRQIYQSLEFLPHLPPPHPHPPPIVAMNFFTLAIVFCALLERTTCSSDGEGSQDPFQGQGAYQDYPGDGDGQTNGEQHDGSGPDPSSLDYQVYKMIDSLNSLTNHQTFYELLGIPQDADTESIGAAFRSASRAWHPDKHTRGTPEAQAKAHDVFTLLASAKTILTSELGKARYDWILHDAPPWHRSRVMLASQWKASPKLSVFGVVFLLAAFSLAAQIVVIWMLWLYKVYWIWSSRRSLHANAGPKELKRMKKKLQAGGDAAVLALWSSDGFQLMATAQKDYPPYPGVREVWPLSTLFEGRTGNQPVASPRLDASSPRLVDITSSSNSLKQE